MTQDQLQKNITDRMLDELKKANLMPEQGVNAIMGACMTILRAVGQTVGKNPKTFVKSILAQAFMQA